MEPKMKMNKHILLAAAAAGVLLSGCVKEKGVEPGSAINFSASSAALETRTVYSDNVSGQMQYIDWVSGDKMTIAKVHKSATQACDYSVSTRTASTGSKKSVATVTSSPASGQSVLTWNGEGSHTFYAMYPAGTLSANVLSGTVAASQTADMNMPSGYMFATETVDVGPTYTVKTVDLEFAPSFTAFQFTLTNSTSDNITLSSFVLKSKTTALNGAISYSFGSTPTISHETTGEDVTDEEKAISSDASITVPANGDVTFVFTSLPNSFVANDLSISCTANGTTRKLPLTHAFGANLKHNLTITLPDFTSYTYTMEVIDNPVDFDYAAGTSSTGKIRSFKSNGDPVAWHVQGFYNSSSAAETKSSSGAISTPSWIDASSTTDMSGGSNAGGNSVELSIKHGAVTPSESDISSDIASTINSIIAGRTSVGTSEDPINLANPNNAGTDPSTYIAESANCYVVNRAGWYKIPLVMGNGVKNNATNTLAASYQGASSSSYFKTFRDYKNQNITSPYLQNSNSSTDSAKKAGTPSSASVWQDVTDLVTDCSIMGNTTTTSDGKTVYWLQFQVSKANIQQGSSVINVSDGSKNMWSYHIWVCDHDAGKDITASGSTYMPYPLGWVATGGTISKKSYSVYARLEQDSPGTGYCVLELVCPDKYDQNHSTTGTAPYYQWGRKDPLKAGSDNCKTLPSGVGFTNNYYLSIADYPNKALRPYSLGTGVNTFWSGGSTAQSAINLWNAQNTTGTTIGQDVSKTIYDPCPAGYRVPSDISSPMDICSPDQYLNPNASSPTLGGDQDFIYFWTCVPSTSSNYTIAQYYLGNHDDNGYSLTVESAIQMYAMRVLPVKE